MALALSKQIHHLTLVPKLDTSSFLLEIVILAFGSLFILGTRASDVNNPKSNAFVGTGAFNLVEKSALGKTEVFGFCSLGSCYQVVSAPLPLFPQRRKNRL